MKWVFKLVSDIGLGGTIGFPLILSILFFSRDRALYYVVNLFIAAYISAFFKLSYQEGRPFWAFADVNAYQCSNDFGAPSGHSSMSMHMTLITLLDLLSSYGYTDLVANSVLSVLSILVIPIPVGISRLYNGVHALD